MTISSRTPEGIPQRCPVCGKVDAIEPSDPAGDACCPSCGHLLWWFRDLASKSGVSPDRIILSSPLSDEALGDVLQDVVVPNADSLEVVDLIMSCEEEFGCHIPASEYERLRTVGDAIRSIQRHRRDE